MATSAEQINDLIGGYTDLKGYFEGVRGQINADLNAAENRVGDTNRSFFVDQVNGNDANDGASSATPLKTLAAAVSKSVWGGRLTIKLMSDYVMDNQVSFRTGSVRIQSDTSGVLRNITFADRISDESITAPRFSSDYDVTSFIFQHVRLTSRVMAPHVTSKHMISAHGLRIVTLIGGEVVAQAGDDLAFLQGEGGHGAGFEMTNTVASADMAGLWVEGVPAGTDPTTIRFLTYAGVATL